ncbi:MAG: NAD-dependent epimerase/dehydratase family protein [Kofleriaceae bacterium]
MRRAQRVVIAGASGFIGQRTCAALAAAGHIAIDLPRADITTIVDETVPLDGTAAAGTSDAPRTRRIVDALAGEADVLVWAAGKRQPDRATNIRLHATAPMACARAIGVHRVIYLSSGEVYGTAPLPYREDGPVLGTSDYAHGKLAGERALVEATSAHATLRDAFLFRLALVYGPGSKPPMLIPRLVAALRADERFPMTHGEQTRDLVFVDDVARAIVAAVETSTAPSTARTYNIASGVEVRIREVVEGVARAVAASTSRPFGEVLARVAFGEVALRPDEAHRYVMDVSRARAELGFFATTTLAEGFARL